jgi:release factor glutamine methyltransferase
MEITYEPTPESKGVAEVEFDGTRLLVNPEVYEPREDSFLLAKAVQKFARGRFLDLGCGSGIQGIVAAKKPEVLETLGVDVNEAALKNAEENALRNGVAAKCRFAKGALFSALGEGETFDTIAFNPPYLPTSKGDKVKGIINEAWDGGRYGRRVINAFLREFSARLAKGGQLLFLQSSLAGTRETINTLKKQDFHVAVEGREKLFFEELLVLRARRKRETRRKRELEVKGGD